MKILLVQESDWLKRNPHQQHHLMERLSLRGHYIVVIDYDIDWKNKPKKKIFSKRSIFNNVHKIRPGAKIKVIRPFSLKIPVLEYVSVWFSHRKEIKRQINDFKPDVIVGLGIINTYIASKLAKKNKIPFVYYWIDVLHTLIPSKIFQPLGRYFEKIALNNSSQIITINEKLSEYVSQIGVKNENISVIKSGIDLERYDPEIDGSKVREAYGIKKEDNVLFFMGWLYHFSGLKEVALELAKSNDNNTKLLIVGDGDAFEDLKQIKVKYDISNQIILAGKQPFEKIPEFISSSNICLLPAYADEKIMQDIVPIKVYEYLAMGKTVITTFLPGIFKEFGNDCRVMYVDESKDVFEKAIELIENGVINEEGWKSKKFAEKHDWNKITGEFEKTLYNVLKE